MHVSASTRTHARAVRVRLSEWEAVGGFGVEGGVKQDMLGITQSTKSVT